MPPRVGVAGARAARGRSCTLRRREALDPRRRRRDRDRGARPRRARRPIRASSRSRTRRSSASARSPRSTSVSTVARGRSRCRGGGRRRRFSATLAGCRRCASAVSRSRSPRSRSRSFAENVPVHPQRHHRRRTQVLERPAVPRQRRAALPLRARLHRRGGSWSSTARGHQGRALVPRRPRRRAARAVLRDRAGPEQAARLRPVGRDRRARPAPPRVQGRLDQRQGPVPAARVAAARGHRRGRRRGLGGGHHHRRGAREGAPAILEHHRSRSPICRRRPHRADRRPPRCWWSRSWPRPQGIGGLYRAMGRLWTGSSGRGETDEDAFRRPTDPSGRHRVRQPGRALCGRCPAACRLQMPVPRPRWRPGR